MSTLRKKLIRLAHENPELRGDILPLLKTRTAAPKLDIYLAAQGVVNDAERVTGKKLEKLIVQAARMMKPHKFTLVPTRSYLYPAGYGSSDGSRADGEIVFKDEGPTWRTEEEGRKIFDDVLGAWPSRRGDLWTLSFEK